MLINLKKITLNNENHTLYVDIDKRLPASLQGPFKIQCNYSLIHCDSYYLLNLEVKGDITVICQRCLDGFNYPYFSKNVIAICNTDEQAEQLMENYDAVVADNNQIDLREIVTDELHLYAPEFHQEITQCNEEINKFIHKDFQFKN